MSEWDQFPAVSGGTAVDDSWDQFPVIDSGQDYDFKAAAQAGAIPDPVTGHWPDTFKKPNHPTFSDESIYAKDGLPGHWEGDKFIASGEKSAATRSFYGLPQTAPAFAPTPDRVGPDPNEIRPPTFPEFMFSPQIQVPRMEHTPDESPAVKYIKALGNIGGEFVTAGSAPMMLAAPIPSIAAALPEMVPAQIQRIQEAEKTPAWSPERIEAGGSTVLQLAGLGMGARAGREALRVPMRPVEGPKISEPVKTTQEARKASFVETPESADQVPPEKLASSALQSEATSPLPQPEPLKSGNEKQGETDLGLTEADVNAGNTQGQQEATREVLQSSPQPPQSESAQVSRPPSREEIDAARQSLAQGGITTPTLPALEVEVSRLREQQSQAQRPSENLTPTATKNAITNAERETRGIAPAEEVAAREFGEVWSQAERATREDPTAPARLVEEIGNNPRALSDHENALLLRRQIEVQNEHDAAIKAVNDAPGDVQAQSRLDGARDAVQTVYDAAKSAGTETGRGLNARKMLANADFSLAKMEAETRAVANAGRPLSPKQAVEVKGLWERINKAEAKVAAYEAMGDFRKSVQVARRTRNKPFSVVTFFNEKEVAAKERIMARRGRLYADPLGIQSVAHLVDESIVGAAHLARGLRNFKDWSGAMLKDFGDGIKPYLKALFAKSQGLHSEAARLSAAKSRTVTQTVKTMSRIGAEDFEPRKVEPVKPDKELMGLQGNLQRAKDIYFQRLFEAKERNRPLHSKILRTAVKTINTSRALKTSFDVSAVGRQGGWIGAGHPILAAKNIKPMFEAMRSVEGQYRIEQEIKSHPDYALAKQAKLDLTEISNTASMTKAEEAYMNSLADKIPGVAGSQRAYVTYLNKLRIETFGQLVKDLSKTGKVTPQEARLLANYVNVATGRGYVGKWAGAFSGLNHVFFAPRYVLSRFQLLLGQPLFHQLGKASPRVRGLIAKEYARSLAGTATVIGLGVAAGATFNTNEPRSADYLKLKFGNSRLDPFYGLQQTTVFLDRAGYNVLRASRHEKVPFKERDVTQRFVRSKLAPAYGSGLNMATGTNFLGQPTSIEKEALDAIDPIAREDIIKAFKEQGVEKGAALSILSLLGMGLQTYDPKKAGSKSKLEKPDLGKALHRRKLSQITQFLESHTA